MAFCAWQQCAIASLKHCKCIHEQSLIHISLNLDVMQSSVCTLASAVKRGLTERGLL